MTTTTYTEFLAAKTRLATACGRPTSPDELHPSLHPWQADIVTWATERGRAAIWADTGLGKTRMQIEWARTMGDTTLIVAPLAVCHQTIREAATIGVTVNYTRAQGPLPPGMWITNYEMCERIDAACLDAVVLDEASILKQSDGKTRTRLIRHFTDVKYRLACTATPAPNDTEELTSQAEFLGVTTRTEMLAAYFVHDQDGWRPKGHAKGPMYRWMTSWAVAIRRPSDMGHPDDDYTLPGLRIIPHMLGVQVTHDGQLFATDLGGVGGRAKVRKQTLAARCAHTADLIAAEPDEPWLLWCGLNDEADTLAHLIPGSVNVPGSWTPEDKADALLGFADGRIRVLITKPSIAGFGMNFQHCARMAFVGLSDSYEAYYQSIRRCYRYGQPRIVHAHVILSELESQIAANIARKEREANHIIDGLVTAMRTTRDAEGVRT